MGTVILGVLLSVISSVVLGMVGYLIYDNISYDSKLGGIVCIVVTVLICITSTSLIIISLCSYDKLYYTKYISTYKMTKTTIEDSVKNNDISGLERLQLVQSAIDANVKLTETQFDCQQWYGFLMDKDVLELEPINFK